MLASHLSSAPFKHNPTTPVPDPTSPTQQNSGDGEQDKNVSLEKDLDALPGDGIHLFSGSGSSLFPGMAEALSPSARPKVLGGSLVQEEAVDVALSFAHHRAQRLRQKAGLPGS